MLLLNLRSERPSSGDEFAILEVVPEIASNSISRFVSKEFFSLLHSCRRLTKIDSSNDR